MRAAWTMVSIALVATSARADVTAPVRVGGEPVAYLASDEAGLVRLDARGRRTRLGNFKHAAGVVALGESPKTIFVLDGMSVWRIGVGGDGAERIGSILRPGLALYLDGGARGPLWSANQREVSAFRDGSWSTRLLPDGPRTTGVSRFAVDDTGAAWVSNERGLWRTDGDGWRAVPPPPGQADVKFCSLDGGASLLLGCWEAVWRWEGGSWRKLASLPRVSVSHVALGVDGRVYVSGYAAGAQVWVIPPDGDEPRVVARKHVGVHALVVDGRGRAWLATDEGVELYDRDAQPIGPRWLRRLGTTRGLLVVGDGPRLRD